MTAHLETWPLALGETLTNHDWWPFQGHAFLRGGLVQAAARGRRADAFIGVQLLAQSIYQDPAGTLPQDTAALAFLAHVSPAEMEAAADVALDGWVPVQVLDLDGEPAGTRLGAPGLTLDLVCDLRKRKVSRDAGRKAALVAVRKSRIRKHLRALGGVNWLLNDEMAMDRLADHFAQPELYISRENVRQALVDVLGVEGNVTRLPRGSPAD